NLVVDQLQADTGVVYPPCTTDRVKISGGEWQEGTSFETMHAMLLEEGMENGLGQDSITDIIMRYGSNTRLILQYYRELSDRSLSQEDRLLYAEILYCIDHEMTVGAVDFLMRRT